MSVFALQYARALADAVMSDKLDTGLVDWELGEFLAAYNGNKELREVFANPSIPLDSKLKVMNSMAERAGMANQVRNFLSVLLQNDRMGKVGSIVAEYRKQINQRLHISEAEITSVRDLSAEEKSRIEAKAASLAGMQVQATYRQDPSLLGGLVLRIGDTVYDGSVRGSLETLREKLVSY